MKKTSTFQNGLIWFGAGVSLAEILTGTAFAPLGMAKGLAAIVIGHIIGCAMMLLAGLIGGRTGRSAMETVKMSFGQKGGLLFAFLNVLQLVGWTAIMIYDGALAIGGIFNYLSIIIPLCRGFCQVYFPSVADLNKRKRSTKKEHLIFKTLSILKTY